MRSCKSVIHVVFGGRKSRWLMRCKVMLPDFCSHLKCGDCLEYVGMIPLLWKSISKTQWDALARLELKGWQKEDDATEAKIKDLNWRYKKKVGLNDFNVFWMILGVLWPHPKAFNITRVPVENLFFLSAGAYESWPWCLVYIHWSIPVFLTMLNFCV